MRWVFACLWLMVRLAPANAATWYVDVSATGANNGKSPANAWTDLAPIDRAAGNVSPGDTVIIVGGLYTNQTTINLQGGTSGNWVRYYVTNGLVHVRRVFQVYGYTELNGGLNRNIIPSDNLYALDSITNNIGFWIDCHDRTVGLVSGLNIVGEPTIIKWIENTGAPSTPSPGDTLWNVHYDYEAPATMVSELAYYWINRSSGRGTTGDIGIDVPGTGWGNWNIHHGILETNQSDILHPATGTDFHHNVIRSRTGAGQGGCNDTFVIGNPNYVRIYNNLIEPADNTLYYLWGAPQFVHDFYFYNNIIMPVPPAFQATANHQTSQGSGIAEQDILTQGLDYYIASNVLFYCNTWVSTTNDGPGGLCNFVTKNGLTNNIFVDAGGMSFLNNLFVEIDTTAQSTRAPMSFIPQSVSGRGTNDAGRGYYYSPSSIIVDYNLFGAYVTGNIACVGWGQTGDTPRRLMNSSDIQRVLGYTHNATDNSFRFVDAPNFNFQPKIGNVTIGTNLTVLTNVMPSINQDVYGQTRPATGPWVVGAANLEGPALQLSFARDDGWVTNGIVTDRSGSGNHAYLYPSTNRNTLPTWTNGPGHLDAAQFVVNKTNHFTYGTYLVIPLTNAANQSLWAFTSGSWMLWFYLDTPHIDSDLDDIFLTTGQQQNNWMFGDYYQSGPQFSRVTTTDGQEPMEGYARWANVSAPGWHHYGVTWDGTNWVAYYDGALWTNSTAWTNGGAWRNSHTRLTNRWTGTLVSTNALGGPYNWLAVGVNSHSGTPNPDDGDGLPNNGQLYGRLADVRIYKRALTAAEVTGLYRAGTTGTNGSRTIKAMGTRGG